MSERYVRRRHRPHLAPVLSPGAKRVLRAEILQRDGDGCFFCAHPLGDDTTLEHVEDWAAGGSNDLANLALAHFQCNYDAQGLTVAEKMLRRGDALLARMQLARAA